MICTKDKDGYKIICGTSYILKGGKSALVPLYLFLLFMSIVCVYNILSGNIPGGIFMLFIIIGIGAAANWAYKRGQKNRQVYQLHLSKTQIRLFFKAKSKSNTLVKKNDIKAILKKVGFGTGRQGYTVLYIYDADKNTYVLKHSSHMSNWQMEDLFKIHDLLHHYGYNTRYIHDIA